MVQEITITTEPDPVPFVLILAAQLRRSARHPAVAPRLARLRGVAALRSATDPQAATMRFEGGRVGVQRGVAADAGVVITTDLDRLGEPGAPRPRVEGALRHPRLALGLAKVLDPPARDWAVEAAEFWEFARRHRGTPASIAVVCSDDGRRLELGPPPFEYVLEGPAHRLHSVFSGTSVLGQDLYDGRLWAVGRLSHTAELSGRSLAWCLGAGAPGSVTA